MKIWVGITDLDWFALPGDSGGRFSRSAEEPKYGEKLKPEQGFESHLIALNIRMDSDV